MEITDLQINDWVYDKSLTVPNLPCRIYSIEGRFPRKGKDFNDQPLIVVWVGDGFLSSHIENIEPIPLIKEILEKNPQVEELGYWDERSNLFRLFAMPCINLWSVDRLQKALRLCGLNELADNFKI